MSFPATPFDSPAGQMSFRQAVDDTSNAAIAAALASNDPKPVMEPAADSTVHLPGGISIGGRTVTSATVKELTGRDEEDLDRAWASGRPEQLMTTLLKAGVVEVGGPVTEELLDRMLVGDRDALMVGIRRVSFGPSVEFERYTCPECSSAFALSVDLADVPVTVSDTPADPQFEVELRGGRKAKVRHVTGADQHAMIAGTRERKLTSAEQNTLLLSRVVLAICSAEGTWNELASANPYHVREGLSMADRSAIIREILQRRPGPRLDQVPVTCPDCQHVGAVALTVEALFRN